MQILLNEDNIDVLNRMPNELVDLIYIDPPFFSNRNYKNKVDTHSFEDKWIDMNEYIKWMKERVREMHRVLKHTGSFYLHCDWHASHYLKIMLDEVFGMDNFQNEIVWVYKSGGASSKRWGRKHDTIFFYTKSNDYVFNASKEKSYMGLNYSTGNKNVTLYDDNDGKGPYTLVNAKDWWEIGMLSTVSKERLDYPTQKPEILLEKIINASSNENDIVFDAFCGSGTAIAVAHKLNRKWIGIDISSTAIELVKQRLRMDGNENNRN